jgi:hypothetical protein
MSTIKCEEVVTSEMRRNKSKTLGINNNKIKIEHKMIKNTQKEEIYPPCSEFNLAEKNEPCDKFNDESKRKNFQNLVWNIKI